MNKNIKKALVAGASLLMLSSIGMGAGQVNSNVYARRTHYSRNHKRHARRHVVYSYQSGNWFVQNGRKLYKRYKSKKYYKWGRDNVKYLSNLSLKASRNTLYKYGWIITFVNNDQMPSRKAGGTAQAYNHAKKVYYSGIHYARHHHYRYVHFDNYSGNWSQAL